MKKKTQPNLLSIGIKPIPKTQIAIPNNNNGNDYSSTSSSSRNISSVSSPRKPKSTQNPNERELRIEKKELTFIRHHLKKARDFIFAFSQFNHSSIIQDSRLLGESEELSKLFTPFQREANSFFHQLDELKKPIYMIQIQDLKSASFTFLQKWKEFSQIIELIRVDGQSSLYTYISIKCRKIDFIIHDIITKNRKASVHIDTLENRGGNLQSLLHALKISIQQLLLHTDISLIENNRIDLFINDIKSFLRLYNDTHYKEFPKSGYPQVDLTQFKSEVMAECNDIIEALRAAFSLHSDLDKIVNEANEITTKLTKIINRLNLPTAFKKVVPTEIMSKGATDQNIDQNKIYNSLKKKVDLSHIEEFIEPEKNIVVCSKLETFLDEMEERLFMDKDYLDKTVWERLEDMKTEFLEQIRIAEEKTNHYRFFKKEIEKQGIETAEIMEESQEKKRQFDREKRDLNEEIEQLKNRINILEKTNETNQKTIDEKDKLIKKLRNDNDEKVAKNTLNRIGQKMSDIMTGNESNLDLYNDNKKNTIQSVDKMNVFVLERRCQKCMEFEQMRKNIRNALKDVIGLENGETILEVVGRLKCEVVNLRETNARLVQENTQALFDLTELRRCAIEIIQTSSDDMSRMPISSLGEKSVKNVVELTKKYFEELRKHHQDELKKLENTLKQTHAADLFEISNKLGTMICRDSNNFSPSSKASNYKTLVMEKIEFITNKFVDTEKELLFSKDLLGKVEKWMNIQSELRTDNVPIDQALIMMMDFIEHKPNPLEKIVNRLENKIYLLNKGIVQITKNVQKMLQKNDVDPEQMELFEMLNYVQIEINELVNTVDLYRETLDKQTNMLSDCQSAFKSIGKTLYHVLEQDQTVLNDMKVDELMIQCLTAVEDVANPKARHFIAIADVNNLTRRTRKNAKIPTSLDPLLYLPLLDERMHKYRSTFNVIEALQPALLSIFNNFDFKVESMDPENRKFSMLREQIFQMNGILGKLVKGDILKTVDDVLQRFVTMATSFVSCIAEASYVIRKSVVEKTDDKADKWTCSEYIPPGRMFHRI